MIKSSFLLYTVFCTVPGTSLAQVAILYFYPSKYIDPDNTSYSKSCKTDSKTSVMVSFSENIHGMVEGTVQVQVP